MNKFRILEKIDGHICKLEITNPTFESFYTKNWLDRNGCNAIYCSKLGEEVAILHCENCTSSKKTCGWDPYTLTVKNKDEVTHLEAGNYIYECKMRFREILWSKIVQAVK